MLTLSMKREVFDENALFIGGFEGAERGKE